MRRKSVAKAKFCQRPGCQNWDLTVLLYEIDSRYNEFLHIVKNLFFTLLIIKFQFILINKILFYKSITKRTMSKMCF